MPLVRGDSNWPTCKCVCVSVCVRMLKAKFIYLTWFYIYFKIICVRLEVCIFLYFPVCMLLLCEHCKHPTRNSHILLGAPLCYLYHQDMHRNHNHEVLPFENIWSIPGAVTPLSCVAYDVNVEAWRQTLLHSTLLYHCAGSNWKYEWGSFLTGTQ